MRVEDVLQGRNRTHREHQSWLSFVAIHVTCRCCRRIPPIYDKYRIPGATEYNTPHLVQLTPHATRVVIIL